MTIEAEIEAYLASQPEAKAGDLRALHGLMLRIMPGARLWFLDGRDAAGKVVSNPNIGYGAQVTALADGTAREFYQVGISANTVGISVYIMGLTDRTWLPRTYGGRLGKASVTGYCIKFKRLGDLDLAGLEAAVRDGVARTGGV